MAHHEVGQHPCLDGVDRGAADGIVETGGERNPALS